MDEILRQLGYIPERIYGLWSTAIVMTVIASLLLYYLYKVYKKFDTDKTFSKCLRVMNKEDFVSLEVAKLLDTTNVEFPTYYRRINNKEGDLLHIADVRKQNISMICAFPAPTLYQAQQYLWSEHKLLVTAFLDEPFAEPYQFLWSIQDANKEIDNYGNVISKEKYSTYQEALNAGILKALELI